MKSELEYWTKMFKKYIYVFSSYLIKLFNSKVNISVYKKYKKKIRTAFNYYKWFFFKRKLFIVFVKHIPYW